jgi:Zn-dependent protease/CBS domain-containing protein
MKSFRVGSAFDIPVKLDLTFLLVLPVFAYLIGVQLGELDLLFNRLLGLGIGFEALTAAPVVQFGIGTAAALGLFVCILLHELGHSLVARRYEVPIESITLWLLGGVAQMAEIPEDWRKEFTIAIAGPLVSVGVGAAAYGLLLVVPSGGVFLEATRFTLAYLSVMNVTLAAFNMLPGFPMDGGRILRALLARTRPHATATQQAARVGQLFAVLLGVVGLLAGFQILLIVLAGFIYLAAASEASRTAMEAALEGVTVREVMTRRSDLDTVPADATVAELTRRMFRERHTGYPVVAGAGAAPDGADGTGVVGVVSLSDAREVDEIERDAYRVSDVMRRDVPSVAPETAVIDAADRMQTRNLDRLLVMEADGPGEPGELVGLLSQTDVRKAVEIAKSGGAPESRGRSVGNDASRPPETLDRDRV